MIPESTWSCNIPSLSRQKYVGVWWYYVFKRPRNWEPTMSIFNVRTLAWVSNLLRNALYDNYSQHTSSILLTFSIRKSLSTKCKLLLNRTGATCKCRLYCFTCLQQHQQHKLFQPTNHHHKAQLMSAPVNIVQIVVPVLCLLYNLFVLLGRHLVLPWLVWLVRI